AFWSQAIRGGPSLRRCRRRPLLPGVVGAGLPSNLREKGAGHQGAGRVRAGPAPRHGPARCLPRVGWPVRAGIREGIPGIPQAPAAGRHVAAARDERIPAVAFTWPTASTYFATLRLTGQRSLFVPADNRSEFASALSGVAKPQAAGLRANVDRP